MKKGYLIIIVFAFIGSIYFFNYVNNQESQKYPDRVGDIDLKRAYDDSGFEICGRQRNIRQYYNFGKGLEYQGDRKALQEEIKSKYTTPHVSQSGWIRIRFVVNCKGETGGFEILESNEDFEPFSFDSAITDQLMNITKSLAGWKILPSLENSKDYYQYVLYKIRDGEIIEIMP